MSHWATSSSAGLAAAAVAWALACAAPVAAGPAAGPLLGGDEALELAFPGCRVERGTVYLTAEQRAEAARRAGGEAGGIGAVVHPYTARCAGGAGGTAYFDVHRVRTLPETLMVALTADGRVRRVEVVAFHEPPDYLPRGVWYRQFEGERLDRDLDLGRDVRGVAGATLTARATTAAVRRVLAIHRVLVAASAADEKDGTAGETSNETAVEEETPR